MAEIVGIEKIVRYINKYDFRKIKLSKGMEVIYIKRSKENETQADLVADFQEFCDEFIQPTNTKDYKLELFGSYNEDPNAKLSPVIKATVAFSERAAVAGEHYSTKNNQQQNSQPIDVDKYVAVATENATLKAQLERMEEKLDEMLEDEDDEDQDVGQVAEPETIGQALNRALISKLDTVIDVVLARLAMPQMAQAMPISGVGEDVLIEFRTLHPEIDNDLKLLLVIAKNQPDLFKMLIMQLRNMVK